MGHKLFHDRYIVVTGGAGLIGSGIVRHLNDLGYDNIIVVDDFHESMKWKNLVKKKFVDFISKHKLFDWLEGKEDEIEAFFHLGACSSTVEKDGDYLMDNNYRYTLRLAEYALKSGIRFIYASSAATYGSGENGFSDDHELLQTLEPMNLYGYSKHLFDLWAQRQGVLDQIVGLKYFNVYGPNEMHKGRMASMVQHMFHAIQEGKPIELFASNHPKYGDGEQVRDFIYVKDAVKMTCSFLDDKSAGIYNIGTSSPTTWNELATSVFEALNLKPNIQYVPMPKDLVGKYQNYTCADMTKFQQRKAFSFTPLKEAVKDYVQNYLLLDQKW